MDRIGEAVERIEATLSTMSGLARFRGHFYNWYSTRDLQPLDPLCLVCRQRQSGCAPARARQRMPGVGQCSAHGCAPPRRRRGHGRSRPPEVEHLRNGRRTQSGTFQHLEDALAVLVAGVQKLAMDGEDIEDQLRNCAGPAGDHGQHRTHADDRVR